MGALGGVAPACMHVELRRNRNFLCAKIAISLKFCAVCAKHSLAIPRASCLFLLSAPMRPLLLDYVDRARALRPLANTGIQCPPELVKLAADNGFQVDLDTVADGNCGLHAFAISCFSCAKKDAHLNSRSLYKQMLKRKGNTQSLVDFLREGART